MELATVVLSGIIGIVSSVITWYLTNRANQKQELQRWRRDLAIRSTELKSQDTVGAQRLIRQFAFAYLSPVSKNDETIFIPSLGRLYIGRDSSLCDAVIQARNISKIHAVITVTNGRVFLEDMASTGGTYVNEGNVMRDKRELKSGDEISFAGSLYVYVDFINKQWATEKPEFTEAQP